MPRKGPPKTGAGAGGAEEPSFDGCKERYVPRVSPHLARARKDPAVPPLLLRTNMPPIRPLPSRLDAHADALVLLFSQHNFAQVLSTPARPRAGASKWAPTPNGRALRWRAILGPSGPRTGRSWRLTWEARCTAAAHSPPPPPSPTERRRVGLRRLRSMVACTPRCCRVWCQRSTVRRVAAGRAGVWRDRAAQGRCPRRSPRGCGPSPSASARRLPRRSRAWRRGTGMRGWRWCSSSRRSCGSSPA